MGTLGPELQKEPRYQVTHHAYLAIGTDCCTHQALSVQLVCPSLLEVSFTLPTMRKVIKWWYCVTYMFCFVESVKLHHYFTFGDISTDYNAVHSIDTLSILCIQQNELE